MMVRAIYDATVRGMAVVVSPVPSSSSVATSAAIASTLSVRCSSLVVLFALHTSILKPYFDLPLC